MGQRYEVLRDEDVEHFLERGFVRVRRCFSEEDAARYLGKLWPRLGYDPDDRSTWEKARIHMPTRERVDAREFAPKAWAAACDLVGGAERIDHFRWGDGFIVNLAERADEPWKPPSPASPGWHSDGDFFRHFLDSPEQGLLTLVLWSDVVHQGGATFVAADSVGPVARFLADHPEGVLPGGGFDTPRIVSQCHDFAEATGEFGDVYLLHPFILHANGPNPLRRPRVITNPPLSLRQPMRFDRSDPDELSLVERGVLRGLGVERYEFRPTRERERIEPMRVQRQAQMLKEENERLGVA